MLFHTVSGLLLFVSIFAMVPGTETVNIIFNNSSLQNVTGSDNLTAAKYGHTLHPAFVAFTTFSFLFIITVSVSCNSVLIVTIVLSKKLHTSMHMFMVNMAVSDLITAIGTIPFDVEYMLRGYFGYGLIWCGIMQTTFLISLPSSMLGLSLLTAERVISIMFPLKISKIITKKRVVMAVAVTWTYVLLTALFPLMYDKDAVRVEYGMCYLVFPLEYNTYQVIVNFIVPIVFICASYGHIYCLTQRMATGQPRVRDQVLNVVKPTFFVIPTALARNIKAAKRIGIVILMCLICWLTFILIVAANYVCRCHPREVTWAANIINYSSTAINPVLYGLLMQTIRGEMYRGIKHIKLFFSVYLRRRMKGESHASAAHEMLLLRSITNETNTEYTNTE